MTADGNVSLAAVAEDSDISSALETTIRKSPSFKNAVSRMKVRMSKDISDLVKICEEHLIELTFVHKYSPAVLNKQSYEDALQALCLTEIKPRPFAEQPPTRIDIQSEVSKEADEQVSSLAFWRLGELRRQYFDNHYWERYNEAISLWENRKASFERAEASRVEEENLRRRNIYESNKQVLELALSGDTDYVCSVVTAWANEVQLPLECEISFEFDQASGVFHLDVICPSSNELPQFDVSQLRSGFLRAKNTSDALLRKRYAAWMFSNDLFLVLNIFNASPVIQQIWITNYVPLQDDLGLPSPKAVISAKLQREHFEGLKSYLGVDAEGLVLSGESHSKMTKGKVLRVVEPF